VEVVVIVLVVTSSVVVVTGAVVNGGLAVVVGQASWVWLWSFVNVGSCMCNLWISVWHSQTHFIASGCIYISQSVGHASMALAASLLWSTLEDPRPRNHPVASLDEAAADNGKPPSPATNNVRAAACARDSTGSRRRRCHREPNSAGRNVVAWRSP